MVEDIETYLESKGCELRDRGSLNIHTHCFFHDEPTSKKGRLYINVDQSSDKYGYFFCHRCGEKGSFNRIRRHFGDQPLNEKPESQSNRLMEEACRFYEANLRDNYEAVRYLIEERGLTENTIRKFRLGWANGGYELSSHLVQSGFPQEQVSASHLFKFDGTDFFDHKIVIPYLEYGRAIDLRGKDMKGKYLSLPNPPGEDRAKLFNTDAIINEPTPVITEGEFGAMVLDQLGIAAVGVPGAKIWKDKWDEAISAARRVNIIFDADKAGRDGAQKLASHIGHKSRVVEIPVEGWDIDDWIVKGNNTIEDVNDLIRRAKGGILVSVSTAYEEWLKVEGNPEGGTYLEFGVKGLDDNLKFGGPGDVMVAIARTNSGKPHTCSTPINTPDGRKLFGDLKVGDYVFGSNGKPTKVTGIIEQGVIDSYRLTFSDGTSVSAGPGHLWTVQKRCGRGRHWVTLDEPMTTLELMNSELKGVTTPTKRGEYKLRIPMTKPVEYDHRGDLKIPPFSLGALLADGSLAHGSPEIITSNPMMIQKMRDDGLDLGEWKPRDVEGKGCPSAGIRGLVGTVRDMGLNKVSRFKFIPREYLEASVEQRIELLQGLMTGDGGNPSKASKSTNKISLHYSSTSLQLMRDIIELISSLGGTATLREADPNNRKPDVNKVYESSIVLPPEIRNIVFKYAPAKRCDFEYKNRHIPHRAIVSIEPEGQDRQRCIEVEAEDHLYLIGENYIVTHNSMMSINMFERMKMVNPELKFMFVSLEQTSNQWFERALRIRNFYEPGTTAAEVRDDWADRMFIVDRNRITPDDLRQSIEQFEDETGQLPDFTVIDYLGYYARGVPGRGEYEQVSEAIMGIKEICKDTKTASLVLHQGNRSGEFGEELEMDQGRGSGQVEQTADILLTMWMTDQAKNIDPVERGKIRQRVKKSRSGGVGTLIEYTFCPLTLAIVPVDDEHYYHRALYERQCALQGDSWQEFVTRLKTGGDQSMIPRISNFTAPEVYGG